MNKAKRRKENEEKGTESETLKQEMIEQAGKKLNEREKDLRERKKEKQDGG